MSLLKKRNMGLGMIALSALFLFNPIVAFFDILPDCFGFLLICSGITLLADLDGHMAEVQKKGRILFWIGILQLLAQLLVYGYLRSIQNEMTPYELPVTILLFSFVQFVAYCAFLIPTFKHLFLGLERLQERFAFSKGDTAAQVRKNERRTERLSRFSVTFVIVNGLMALLPEFLILTSFEHDAMGQVILFGWVKKMQFTFDWYDYVFLFRTLACMISAIVSLIWLIRFLSYFICLIKDKPWILCMQEHYCQEILPQTEMLSLRRFRYSFLILSIGFLFSVNLRMNFYACLPGAVFAFLTFAALFMLGDLLPRQNKCYAACAGLGACSLLEMLVNSIYLKNYLPQDSLYSSDAFWHYLAVQLLGILEAVATLVLVYYLLISMYEVVKQYTGVRYRESEGQEHSSNATKKLHRSFLVRMYVIFILFFVACMGSVADSIFHLSHGWLWLIPLCASVAGIFCFYTCQHDLLEEIGYRFQDEKNVE